jgi:CubicO group peptidase (beta-lactamase class C family)
LKGVEQTGANVDGTPSPATGGNPGRPGWNMDGSELRAFVAERAAALKVPGAAVAVLAGDEAHYAFYGVTSVENPLPVDEHTLFQFGSTGKTFTATAIMRLVEAGQVDLDAPVRTYVPELRLRDEDVARRVTVLHLLNHTAGWDGDMDDDTGWGDDALAQYVARMERLQQLTPLGEAVSYNNASLSLAGRVIEKVTGKTYERAIQELVFQPLGLVSSYFFPNDIMTRRFATGHNLTPDGEVKVARPWALPRGGNAAGGIASNAADQVAWARFHMGDGRAPDGTRILSEAGLRRMQAATVDCFGTAIGDQCAITWWLRDVGGVRTVSHGGTTNGQHSAFVMVPERHFAFVSLTNCGPNGPELNDSALKWALSSYLGVVMDVPEASDRPAAELEAYAGRYETIAAICRVRVKGGGLEADIELKPEALATMLEEGDEPPPPEPPMPLGLIAGSDRYVVTGGPARGMTGFFRRDASGKADAVHMGGRLALRTGDA